MFKNYKKKIRELLRRSQRYTKTDMVYVAKGSFWLNIGQGTASVAGLGLAVAFANLLPPDTYGTFKFIISFVAILSIPGLKGMNKALMRAVAQGNEGVFYPILKTKMKWGVFGSLGALLLAGYYFYNDNSILAVSFLIMAGFIPFLQTLNIWIQYLNGKKNFKTLAQYQAATRIIVVSVIVITLVYTQNLFLILFAHFAANTLVRAAFLLLTLKRFPPNTSHDPPTIGYGKHLSLMGVLGAVSKEIDKILIFHFLGAVQVAIYTFALRPIKEAKKPLQSLNKLAFPRFSQRNMEQLRGALPGKMLRLTAIFIPITALYILIAPYFYQFLFPQYMEAVSYSQIYALSLLVFPKVLMGEALTAHARKKQLYLLRTATPALKVILLLILLPLFDIWGAIIALLATEAFSLCLLLFLFFVKHDCPSPSASS